MSVGIIGAGAFGTALAVTLGAVSPVVLLARDPATAERMQRCRESGPRLPGVALPDPVRMTATPEDLRACDIILLATPMQTLRAVLSLHATHLGAARLVACCKGVERGTGLGPVEVLRTVIPGMVPAILTGPGFATDLAAGRPTAMTLACDDDAAGADLQSRLSTPALRLYRTTDTIGAELGGALKNVMAIACGAIMGAGLGESARAALLTRGYAEMLRFAVARGARSETLSGLSGFGDLVLTCTSGQSRNYRRGLALGQGVPFDDAVTVEGAATARAVAEAGWRMGLDLPLTGTVVALLDETIRMGQAIDTLLSRPLKEE